MRTSRTFFPDEVARSRSRIAGRNHDGGDGTLVFCVAALGLTITLFLMVEFPAVVQALALFGDVP